ncbi:MAG TPA: hypothetical protein VJL90_10865, partial [Pseudorhodoplanes sp.]|nr:hypothetical protein [Pseudorhodoplanes sp.]
PFIGDALARKAAPKIEDELQKKIDAVDSVLESMKKQQEEATATLSSIKKAAAGSGVAQEAVYFALEAGEHKKAATWWASATALFAAGAAIWGGLVLWIIPVPKNADPAELVQHTVGKVIVFTALYYALLWCAKNYRANRHNYVVNKQKQNSLSTFESFVRGADQDVAVKNAVLLQATTAIFSSIGSGYVGKEGDSESPNKVIEIFRPVSDRGQ